MIVKNILAAKQGDVVTIDPTANLAAAVKLLIERHIGAVVSATHPTDRTANLTCPYDGFSKLNVSPSSS